MPDNPFLPAFHFLVHCAGLEEDTDTAFESVSGLQITAGALTGDKRAAPQCNPVVLKRAVSQQPSPLRQWVLQNLNGAGAHALPEVRIQVLDETHQPAITIRLQHVTVAGWQLSPLNAQQSELLTEEILLHYQAVEFLQSSRF